MQQAPGAIEMPALRWSEKEPWTDNDGAELKKLHPTIQPMLAKDVDDTLKALQYVLTGKDINGRVKDLDALLKAKDDDTEKGDNGGADAEDKKKEEADRKKEIEKAKEEKAKKLKDKIDKVAAASNRGGSRSVTPSATGAAAAAKKATDAAAAAKKSSRDAAASASAAVRSYDGIHQHILTAAELSIDADKAADAAIENGSNDVDIAATADAARDINAVYEAINNFCKAADRAVGAASKNAKTTAGAADAAAKAAVAGDVSTAVNAAAAADTAANNAAKNASDVATAAAAAADAAASIAPPPPPPPGSAGGANTGDAYPLGDREPPGSAGGANTGDAYPLGDREPPADKYNLGEDDGDNPSPWKFAWNTTTPRKFLGFARFEMREWALIRYGNMASCMFRWEDRTTLGDKMLPAGWERMDLGKPKVKWTKNDFVGNGWVGMALHNPEPGYDFTSAAAACLDPMLAEKRRSAKLRQMTNTNTVGKMIRYNVAGHGIAIVREGVGFPEQVAIWSFGDTRNMMKKQGGQKFIFDFYKESLGIFLARWNNDSTWKYVVTKGMWLRARRGGYGEERGKGMRSISNPAAVMKEESDDEEDEEDEPWVVSSRESRYSSERSDTRQPSRGEINMHNQQLETIRQLREQREADVARIRELTEERQMGGGPGRTTPNSNGRSGPSGTERRPREISSDPPSDDE
jgi:hypothetical protein